MRDYDQHFCRRCGEEYDPSEVEIPDDATFYWEPHCPVCNAGVTASTIDKILLNICGEMLDRSKGNYERNVQRLNCYARLYHGRTVDLNQDELVERAKMFDERVSHGRRWGPQTDRDVAFNLRRQAREVA